jgi:hypothetical protein
MTPSGLITKLAKRHLEREGFAVKPVDDLTRLADRFGSDKGSIHHFYTRAYRQFFEHFREKEFALLELGLLRPDVDKRRAVNAIEGAGSKATGKAPSLQMWRVYFPQAQLFGFDIDDFSDVHIDRCVIVQGDMSSRDDLHRLVNTIGQQLQIVIDDASHASHHQQICLGMLFPYLSSGGLYVIEDLHWQDDLTEKPNARKTRDVLRLAQATQSFESPYMTRSEQEHIQQNVDKIWLFDSLANDPDPSDALAIIKKR